MFEVVLDHRDFVMVNKTAAVSFHAEQGPGLFVNIEQHLGQKLWPVHRLDKVTTGLLLLAKSAEAAAIFGDAFANRKISKCYLALSDRKPAKKQGWIKGDMAKARRGAWRLLRSTEHPAITRFDSQSLAPGQRLFRLWPQTGRTHQLRVAMKSLGAPILGDSLYGGSNWPRVCLHAYALAFDWQGDNIAISQPADFSELAPPPFE
ncbi:TIGR01621 family pseudouridine synthase [Gallaecimonas sp. GXIMD1310]|uniref:TIGR01621 family pseudouridine synthase n=1 Tax=Gallaecimonas sp. GXIMD1310 TaxID=3131926 RepID=UPI00325184A4